MKLARLGASGSERLAIVDADGRYRDLSVHFPDLTPALLTNLSAIAAIDPKTLPLVEGNPRIGPCVGHVGKFICVGLNYADHAAESGMAVPAEPVLFMKATSAICGPNDDVIIPRGSLKTDWEVELGVVIGREARYVTETEALDHVAGYCVINDVSERVPDRTRRAMDQGQERRYLRADRPLACDPRRGARPAESVDVARG